MSRIPEGLRPKVLADRMTLGRGTRTDRIHISVVPGFAEEVAGALDVALADYQFSGRKVWSQTERDPVVQWRYTGFGNINDYIRNNLLTGKTNVNLECTWFPDSVTIVNGVEGRND